MSAATEEDGPHRPPRFSDHRDHFTLMIEAALEAADPGSLLRSSLKLEAGAMVSGPHRLALHEGSRVFLIAIGKAAPSMTQAAVEILGERLQAGIAAVPEGVQAQTPESVRTFEGGHPLPSKGSIEAGRACADLLGQVQPEDRVVVLISGGGSAMFELPVQGVELEDLRDLNQQLLDSGAPIDEVNAVRKALSRVKGGGLAQMASPAPVLGLVLSDVVGDRLSAVASGPTVILPQPTATPRGILERYDLWEHVSDSIREAVVRDNTGPPPMYQPVNVLLGGNRLALNAARRTAEDLGFEASILTTTLEGEASLLGREFAQQLKSAAPKSCLLQGGEPTVTVHGDGRGGRNQEFALSAAVALDSAQSRAMLAFATDGRDGPTDAAGAVVSGETAAEIRAAGFKPEENLDNNDTYPALDAVGGLIKIGPTGTNVNDLFVGLVYPAPSEHG